jgi:hypothetical protein
LLEMASSLKTGDVGRTSGAVTAKLSAPVKADDRSARTVQVVAFRTGLGAGVLRAVTTVIADRGGILDARTLDIVSRSQAVR